MLAQMIRDALARYEEGNLPAALAIVTAALSGNPADSLGDALSRIERRDVRPSAAAADWLILARDRLRMECGEDVYGILPVDVSLKSALNLLSASTTDTN